ncbi:MAG TPA: tRNA (adenosine(37)-N6)-dimethylallyltransferase MiaA [Candidatus Binatia bacterium]|nr:tRNA (adenosine(37)-N6)-dimethylallyltransferase MiaA [Candidatus Binatia bacterium]
MEKILVILGPTATGKSNLAIQLAKKYNGEIISADSRQIYKGMDLGTGKVSKKEQKIVPHHLLDIASPKRQFTVARFKKLAVKAIKDISQRGRLPILVGGTAFYIYTVIDDLNLPEVKPDLKLRKELEVKSELELFKILKKLDPRRAQNIDSHNKVRLVRAIEIIKSSGNKVPPLRRNKIYDSLIIGLNKPQIALYSAIDKRLEERLNQGMVKEVRKLLTQGVSHKKLETFGLEYRYISLYLQKKLSYEQMIAELKNAIHRFAKRQMTWFKKDSRINWIKTQTQAEKLLKNFI